MKDFKIILLNVETGGLVIDSSVSTRTLDLETEELQSYKLTFRSSEAKDNFIDENYVIVAML
jgi:hypothetical protein